MGAVCVLTLAAAFIVVADAVFTRMPCQTGAVCVHKSDDYFDPPLSRYCMMPNGSAHVDALYCLDPTQCYGKDVSVQCLEQGGAVCGCFGSNVDDDSRVPELCPADSFCSTSTEFQGQPCTASPIKTVDGCQYCCPAGGLPITSRGCLAPFCACNADSAGEKGKELGQGVSTAQCGPYPNWPSMAASKCEVAGNWINCPNFLYAKVDNVSNPQQATPVTKAGKPIASCWSVCEDFCPEFFEAVGGLPGVCKFSLGCLSAGWNRLIGIPQGNLIPDFYLPCKGLPTNTLPFLVAKSANCWSPSAKRPWPELDEYFIQDAGLGCARECLQQILDYRANNCGATLDVKGELGAGQPCNSAGNSNCPENFACCGVDSDDTPPYCDPK